MSKDARISQFLVESLVYLGYFGYECYTSRMATAARAIIIENGHILVMKRIKQGIVYYTLVGGKVDDGETPEQALKREVKEETGLEISSAKRVFFEKHDPPYNDQVIFLCKVAPHGPLEVQPGSEEHFMNKIDINVHNPEWVMLKHFDRLPFNTMRLQNAISEGIASGFPENTIAL